MADLLGSLLPAGYMAPDVQTILGGQLLKAWCIPSGWTPVDSCFTGSDPEAACWNGSAPRIAETRYCYPVGMNPA